MLVLTKGSKKCKRKEENMNVDSIIEDWLKTHGYDGLYHGEGCACKIGDIAPCGQPSGQCEAGYLLPCDGTCDAGKCDFHIGQRPKAPSNEQSDNKITS